jgi:hypothetical protein
MPNQAGDNLSSGLRASSLPKAAHPAGGAAGDLKWGARAALLVLSIGVLSIALPLFLLSETPDQGRSSAWVITFVIMIWGGARLSWTWVSGVPRLFDFFFWLFCYIFMGLAPTAQIRADALSTTTPGVDSSLDMPTAGAVALGIGCYELAHLVWLVVEHLRRASVQPRPPRPVSPLATGVLALAGLAVSAYFVSRIGPGAALGSREAASAAREALWPDPAMRAIMYAAAIYPLVIATGALTQLGRTVDRGWIRAAALGGSLVGAVVLILVVNPISSARYTFGTVAFALVVFAGAMKTRLRARLTMLGTMVAFLFLFPIADAFRREEVRVSRTSFFGEYLNNPDYDSFWQVANALSYWIDGLVEPARQFLGSILFWLPRAIWPDKPTDTGILLADYRDYAVDNLSAPMWAEALVNGGLIAVILVFLALGVALRAMDTRIIPAFAGGGVWAVVGSVLPVFMTILMRGSLLQATGATALMIAGSLFVAQWGKRNSPAAENPRDGRVSGDGASPLPGQERTAPALSRNQEIVRSRPSDRSIDAVQPRSRRRDTSSRF